MVVDQTSDIVESFQIYQVNGTLSKADVTIGPVRGTYIVAISNEGCFEQEQSGALQLIYRLEIVFASTMSLLYMWK